MLQNLPPWEQLLKKIVWLQLDEMRDKKILDFGSGIGVTADHYAADNDVVAVEPSEKNVARRWQNHPYLQIVGSTDALRQIGDETFDVILCHNVLEYADDREDIVREFHRLLKPDGFISIVKHNRSGRVMQMVVLLNEFEKAHNLLDGKDGTAAQYGAIRYYADSDITKWCDGLRVEKISGIRTFWDLQQNQECQKEPAWQEKMIEVELRVSQIQPYRDIAFFHHLIIRKGFTTDMDVRLLDKCVLN